MVSLLKAGHNLKHLREVHIWCDYTTKGKRLNDNQNITVTQKKQDAGRTEAYSCSNFDRAN